MQSPSSYQLIYAVVARIPSGCVATYGQIAQLAGLPRQARQVGYALNRLDAGSELPWHRVVNARGEVSARSAGNAAASLQQQLLMAEGVTFNARGCIPLSDFLWRF